MVAIRSAAPEDLQGIRSVHLAAFPTALEANLVDKLDGSGDVLISLVAEDCGRIVGHVLFSRMDVEADERVVAGMGLAPVAVLPDYQSRGIGTSLIHAALRLAEARGADIVFVLGDPEYYGRFGFDAATAAPFQSPYRGPHFQALVLRPGFKPPRSGRADYAAAFAELG
jgi:putative acetyltransferase